MANYSNLKNESANGKLNFELEDVIFLPQQPKVKLENILQVVKINLNIIFLRWSILLVLALLTSNIYSQDGIEDSSANLNEININRLQIDQILSIPINTKIIDFPDIKEDEYYVDLKVNNDKSTLHSNEYSIIYERMKVSDFKNLKEIYFKLKGDSLPDRKRELYLYIELTRNDTVLKLTESTNQLIKIVINPINEVLNGYEYLAYVGTNFDLVEGVRAKDLFFAANIYSTPKDILRNNKNRKSWGFYLSIYGNRAFTRIDSTAFQRTSVSVSPISEDSYARITATDYYITKEVTDNLGAYFSPLINLSWVIPPLEKRELNLYYSPSLEFVYRRTIVSSEKGRRYITDSIIVKGDINDAVIPPRDNTPIFGQVISDYSFNLGIIGFFLSLENKNISVRVHSSVGYASNYSRDVLGQLESDSKEFIQSGDWFYSGRAWITEPSTGITLTAEVTNLWSKHRPFFVATLSKAFNFKNLGTIFAPIVQR